MPTTYDIYPDVSQVLQAFLDYCYHTLQEFEEVAEQSRPTRYPRNSLENMVSDTGTFNLPKQFITEADVDSNNINHIDPDTGFTVTYVLPHELPRGYDENGNYWEALGLCNYNTKNIKVDKTRPTYEKTWIRAHEIGHAIGNYSETGADAYANSRCGYTLRTLDQAA